MKDLPYQRVLSVCHKTSKHQF